MHDDLTAARTPRTGLAKFTVDDASVRSYEAAAIRVNEERFDAWSNRGMVRPLRLSLRPQPSAPVGVGMPFGEETDLDTVRVILAASPGDPWRHTVRAVYPSLGSGTASTFPALDDFIGAYFNRSWSESGLSPVEVMAHFVSTARPGEIEALAADIRAALELDDEALAVCLVALDCNYDPAEDASTDRSWLTWMVERLDGTARELAPPESAVVGEPGWQRASRPIRGASPRVAVVRFVMNAVTADGRASRSEFWWARVIWGLVCVALWAAVGAVPDDARSPLMIALVVWLIVTAIPNVTLQARRLHDTGRSGWFMLVQLVPIVGPITLLVWNVQDSERSGAEFDHPDEARR